MKNQPVRQGQTTTPGTTYGLRKFLIVFQQIIIQNYRMLFAMVLHVLALQKNCQNENNALFTVFAYPIIIVRFNICRGHAAVHFSTRFDNFVSDQLGNSACALALKPKPKRRLFRKGIHPANTFTWTQASEFIKCCI